MIGIDSMDNSSAVGMFQINKTESAEEDRDKPLISRDKDGDTVNISREAMELFKSKMDEYGARDPGLLTDDQKADLKETMETFAEENGIDPENMPHPDHRPPMQGAEGGQNNSEGSFGEKKREESPSGGMGGSGGAPQAGAAGAQAGSSSTESDDVEDKEDEIEKLKAEIEQLRSKSGTDDKAAEDLKTKELELATLEAELAMLESQSGA